MLARKYRNDILIALAALAISACWLPIRMQFPFDDTYITFRYVANLAHGFGIVWNSGGPHTEGYTNFLFLLLLVPFSAMGWDLIWVSQAIGVVAVVISAIAISGIVRPGFTEHIGPMGRMSSMNGTDNSRMAAWFAAALFLLNPLTWINAFSGMETSLFTMWLLLGFLAFVSNRITLAFVLSTLAALTRPEGAVIGFIFLFVQVTQETKGTKFFSSIGSLMKSAFYCFALPLLVYAAWKLWYFGDLLPNSFYIKVSQANRATFLPGRGTIRIFYEGVWYFLPFALLAVWKGRRNVTVQIAASWCVLLSAFYLFSQLLQPQYGRFTNSIEAMLILLASIGIANWKIGRPIILLALAGLLVILNCIWSLYFRGGMGCLTADTEYNDRYRRIASVFRSIPDREHITFAAPDAGILPYYSGLRNIDVVGLNTSEIARAHSSAEVISIILRSRPELMLIPFDAHGKPFEGGHGLIGSSYGALQSGALQAGYRCITVIPQTVYDLNVLADTTSPHYPDIVNTLVPRIGKDPDFLPPVTKIR